MNEPMESERATSGLQFPDVRGFVWTTGINVADGTPYRWFRTDGRRERRYELRNGDAKDESLASLRAQLHASVPVRK
jgi:hypothetical protein